MNTDLASRQQLQFLTPQDLYRIQRGSSPSRCEVGVKARPRARIPVFLKPEQVEALLSYARTPRDVIILRLLYYSALRVSEVLGLRLEDIDFQGREIRVCHAVTPSGMPKEYKERLVPVDEKTLALIKEYVGSRTEGKIFDLSIRRVQSLVRARAHKAKIPNWRQISPHKLRHSFATHYYRQTKDLIGLQKMLGHSSISTTEIYAHVNIDEVKQLYDYMIEAITDQRAKPVTLNDIYEILRRIEKRLPGGT